MTIPTSLCVDKFYPTPIVDALQSWLKTLHPIDREAHYTILLLVDRRDQIAALDIESTGILDSTTFSAQTIFRKAIIAQASQIILAHNHPFGGCYPTDDDYAISCRMYHAGRLLGLSVMDHIIFNLTEHYSALEEDEWYSPSDRSLF
jgi:DNA repair protein RadC